MIRSLVFCGGGMKCLSYLGVYRALLEYDLIKDIDTLIGTSAGNIIALMILLGYSLEELKDVYFNLDFSVLQDINPERVFEFLDRFGLDSGVNLEKMLQVLIRKKMGQSRCTFHELYAFTKKKFVVTGTNLNQCASISFSYQTHPSMCVIKAILISTAVPLVYQSQIFEQEMYVDGGITNNFPIDLSDNLEETLGFLLWKENPPNKEINNIITYSYALMISIYQRYMQMCRDLYEPYTVIIPVTTSCFNYQCSLQEKEIMYQTGYQSTVEYLEKHRERWDNKKSVGVQTEELDKPEKGIKTDGDDEKNQVEERELSMNHKSPTNPERPASSKSPESPESSTSPVSTESLVSDTDSDETNKKSLCFKKINMTSK